MMYVKNLLFMISLAVALTACGGSSSGETSDQNKNQQESPANNGNSSGNDQKNNQSKATPLPRSANYMLSAWNDLGMHCMDGNDFSVFSILPPYNNLHAQLKDKNGGLISSGVTISYESTTGTDGKINTSSSTKTNFWDYVKSMFGIELNKDIGLKNNPTPSKKPKNLTYNPTYGWWEAEGIPITPYNDDGSKNYYPLVKVTAKDANGNRLAEVQTVLPVSDEMDCKKCHASNSNPDAKPSKGWVSISDKEKEYKFNILRIHDQKMPNAVSSHINQLKAKGYNYDTNGLEATAKNNTPILCAACHKSNALPGVGIGLKPLTQVIHTAHADVTDPVTNKRLGDINNRSACYSCHPGSDTACLRGAMGDAKNSDGTNKMQCQSCHGTMSQVGSSQREGWLDEPNCQACHQGTKRETSAILADGTLRAAVDSRFATNQNIPSQGKSLYRFSRGHGGLQCSACHGSPHAIYPAHTADNLLSQTLQGHIGTVAECSACHNSVPNTTNRGPHGMHTVGQSWVKRHGDIAEHNNNQCKACHGDDFRGTVLSKMWRERKLNGKNFNKGHKVSCYDCHNGPNGGEDDD